MNQMIQRFALKPKRYKVEVLVMDNMSRPIYKLQVLAKGITKWHAKRAAEKALSLKASRAWRVIEEGK